MATRERLQETWGEPTWSIAHLFPRQGTWTVEEYLALDTNRLVEFSDGYFEILPTPTVAHQQILVVLCRNLWAFVTEHRLGEVLFAPLPVELWSEKFREPDVIFIATTNVPPADAAYLRQVDLVMEVVNPDDPVHDYQTKRQEYAQAGIPEYWIVDPAEKIVTVLVLHDKHYQVHQVGRPGMQVSSHMLKGFELSVAAVFSESSPD